MSNSGMPTNREMGKDGQRTGRGQLRGNVKVAKTPAEITKSKEAAPGWFILEYQHGLSETKGNVICYQNMVILDCLWSHYNYGDLQLLLIQLR